MYLVKTAPANSGLANADSSGLAVLNRDITNCRKCPRLVEYREQVGNSRRRAYRTEQYWAKPVPGFGDPRARLLIVGLAPGAHGANRTGRVFTGDRSGEFLYRALFETGFANQPDSTSADDGLVLKDAYIASPVRCVPPDNKPTREEILRCRPYLTRELELLRCVKLVVVLGHIAMQAYLSILQDAGKITSRARFPFAHGAKYHPGPSLPTILACYHPSQQNTSTKRLTREMLREIFSTALLLIEEASSSTKDIKRPPAGIPGV